MPNKRFVPSVRADQESPYADKGKQPASIPCLSAKPGAELSFTPEQADVQLIASCCHERMGHGNSDTSLGWAGMCGLPLL